MIGCSVAENRNVWRSLGTWRMMRRMSGKKPMSSIRSASSSTSTLQRQEVHVALFHMIEQAARRGDDHIDALAQRLLLRAIAHAAVNRGDPQAGVAAQLLGMLGHLQRQFARRQQHQRARFTRARRVDQFLQQRQQKRCRFARAGFGRAENVAPFQRRRNRRALDRRRFLEVHGLDIFQQARIEIETIERHESPERRQIFLPK